MINVHNFDFMIHLKPKLTNCLDICIEELVSLSPGHNAVGLQGLVVGVTDVQFGG